MNDERPLRIVHVVGAMNRAGVETWLMNLARSTSPDVAEFTFVKHSHSASDYDDEILALGHRIVVVAKPRNPFVYAFRLRQLLRRGGASFDAIHSHVGHFTALPMFVAWNAGVPTRIAHSHSDNRSHQRSAGLLRRLYFSVASALIRQFSTVGLASSEGACESLFRRTPVAHGAYQVLPTGIDLTRFSHVSGNVRQGLGVAETCVLVGHIGRFEEVKNHALLVDVARHWKNTGDDVHLALIGDGPLKSQVESDVERAGLQDRVSFLGVRSDIPELLSSVDVLVLPSRYEGVPVTLLEAQASGCPCVISSRIGNAVDVVPGLITRLEIDNNSAAWASETLRVGRVGRTSRDTMHALAAMRSSNYNIEVTLERLRELWSASR